MATNTNSIFGGGQFGDEFFGPPPPSGTTITATPGAASASFTGKPLAEALKVHPAKATITITGEAVPKGGTISIRPAAASAVFTGNAVPQTLKVPVAQNYETGRIVILFSNGVDVINAPAVPLELKTPPAKAMASFTGQAVATSLEIRKTPAHAELNTLGHTVPEKLYVKIAPVAVSFTGKAATVAQGSLLNLVVGTTSPATINNTAVSRAKVRTVQSRFKSLTTSGATVAYTVQNTLPVSPHSE